MNKNSTQTSLLALSTILTISFLASNTLSMNSKQNPEYSNQKFQNKVAREEEPIDDMPLDTESESSALQTEVQEDKDKKSKDTSNKKEKKCRLLKKEGKLDDENKSKLDRSRSREKSVSSSSKTHKSFKKSKASDMEENNARQQKPKFNIYKRHQEILGNKETPKRGRSGSIDIKLNESGKVISKKYNYFPGSQKPISKFE